MKLALMLECGHIMNVTLVNGESPFSVEWNCTEDDQCGFSYAVVALRTDGKRQWQKG